VAAPLVAVMGALLAINCGSSAGPQDAGSSPAPSTAPSPSPVVDPGALSAEVSVRASTGIFVGGDDHVSVVVHNTGGHIGRVGMDMGLQDGWVHHHTMAMGSSPRCQLDPALRGFDCGPIRSGDTAAMVLRATPDDPGSFHYVLAFCDLSAGRQPIRRTDGGDLVVRFDETVTPLRA
jgi:hypothetical protein